ncbi:MAG: DUF4125 family protein [Synergistaceae bacterium]
MENLNDNNDMKNLIEEIIKTEWAFFDKVKNEGGRAECQDDFRTFSIMRRSQYMAWSPAMLESWRADLREAAEDENGRNPMTEKYGYMMCISDPEANAELAKLLPYVSEEQRCAARRITEKLLPQNEAFRKKYPHVAGCGRPLRTSEEKAAGVTSIETYELGELCTYSTRTLALFERHLAELERSGISYPERVIENSLIQRGFTGLAQAEDYIAAKK